MDNALARSIRARVSVDNALARCPGWRTGRPARLDCPLRGAEGTMELYNYATMELTLGGGTATILLSPCLLSLDLGPAIPTAFMTLSTGSGAAVESSGSVVHLPDQGQVRGRAQGHRAAATAPRRPRSTNRFSPTQLLDRLQ